MKPNSAFEHASSATLLALAAALRDGRLSTLSGFEIQRIVPGCSSALSRELERLAGDGLQPRHLAMFLDAKAEAIEARIQGVSCELVWSGPDFTSSKTRDTAIVLDGILAGAVRSVLISSFVVYQGERVFKALAERMDAIPSLDVRLFLHVGRETRDTRDASELLREFADALREQWPGKRHPAVFYDPRALSTDRDIKAAWHAKCVVVDDEQALLTSANFTEWAQQRNVEAGVLVKNRSFAMQLREQFESLVQSRHVQRLPGF